MKVLLLCHGQNHEYPYNRPKHHLCGTSGLTLITLQRVRMKTLDIDWRANPHMLHDITEPITTNHETFDIVSNMYSPYFVFLDDITGEPIANTFNNILKLLKPCGHAVFAIADEGISIFMEHHKLLSRRIRRSFNQYEQLIKSKSDAIRKYVSDRIATHISKRFHEFRVVKEKEKEMLLMKWNRVCHRLYDEHQLIVLKRVS